MSQAQNQHVNIRFAKGAAVIGFADTYLQSEDVIREVSEQVFHLVEDRQLTKVLLTFDGVRFMSSSMFGLVVKLHKHLAKDKGHMKICSLAPQMREILKASQLDKLLDVYEDEASALASKF